MTIRSYLEKFATETPQAEAMEYFGPDKEWHTRIVCNHGQNFLVQRIDM